MGSTVFCLLRECWQSDREDLHPFRFSADLDPRQLKDQRLMVRTPPKRDLFVGNLLVRIRFIIEMIWWTGLAPWDFKFPFSGSLISTFPVTP